MEDPYPSTKLKGTPRAKRAGFSMLVKCKEIQQSLQTKPLKISRQKTPTPGENPHCPRPLCLQKTGFDPLNPMRNKVRRDDPEPSALWHTGCQLEDRVGDVAWTPV